MKNPDLFQGEKYLNKSKNYFEGWYFKNTNSETGISFIPGINIENNNKKAFIQVITNEASYFVNYDINEFESNVEPFYIKIGNNIFSKNGVSIDIKDETQNLNIYGNIEYLNSQNINTNLFAPNIMGLFSYIPFMECNHAILSMQNRINGLININNKEVFFNGGFGYIEKDWGCSFPKNYIWCQGNEFEKHNVSFMMSIADIPFKVFNFRGFICVLMIDNEEYKFTTYNNSKIIQYDVNNDSLNITLRKGKYTLNIQSVCNTNHKLIAPVKGNMSKDILESITSFVTVELKNNDEVIFEDSSKNCGLEIVL